MRRIYEVEHSGTEEIQRGVKHIVAAGGRRYGW